MKNTTTSKDSKKSVLVHEIVKKSVFGSGASRPCRKRKKKEEKGQKRAAFFSLSQIQAVLSETRIVPENKTKRTGVGIGIQFEPSVRSETPDASKTKMKRTPTLALGSNSSRPFDQKPQMPRKQK